jgi:hypothetical protein
MPRPRRSSRRFDRERKFTGNAIFVLVVLAVLALGVWLLARGMSFDTGEG